MEIKTEITITLPPMLAAALEITEDTLFETYFDGNCLRVRTLDEEEVESAILAGLEDAPAEAGAKMELHHRVFQKVFNIAAKHT